mgnify:CR=1 FL=1
MSEYTVHGRGHDAEWLLHRERLINDYQLAQVRRNGKTGGSELCGREVLALTPDDPAEAAAAVRVVHRIAARQRLDAAAKGEVLVMLGLAELPARVPTPRKADTGQARPTGACRGCGRGALYLKTDGTLVKHRQGKAAGSPDCPGSGTPPRKDTMR